MPISTPPRVSALTNEPGKGPTGAHVYVDGQGSHQKMTMGKNVNVQLFRL